MMFYSWQNYLCLNLALLPAYALLKGITNTAFSAKHLEQGAKLRLARHVLLILLAIYLLMPYVISFSFARNTLEWKLLMVLPTDLITSTQQHIQLPAGTLQTYRSEIPFTMLLQLLCIIGISWQLYYYGINLLALKHLSRKAFVFKHIGSIAVLFSDQLQMACCYRLLRKHYILLPMHYSADIKLLRYALCHEIQHIRQHDPSWLHVFAIVKIICFWNPAIWLWNRWCKNLQEYACDEAIALNKRNSLPAYAECLVNAAKPTLKATTTPAFVTAMNTEATKQLYRRIEMLFDYQPVKKKCVLALLYAVSIAGITTSAYALSSATTPLSAQQISALIRPSYAQTMNITAEPEVVKELNRIRTQPQARERMQAALQRMPQYKEVIADELYSRHMPDDLFAMPIVQSGFRALPESANAVKAAGIWQIIPSTAEKLGLTIDGKKDERLDTRLATRAALDYLQTLYKQFKSWKLAVVAYEIGEQRTAALMTRLNTRNAWKIARSQELPKKYQQEVPFYLANFDATVIILHNPHLIK